MGKNGLEFAYSFQSRFENGQGTNPEELAAAFNGTLDGMEVVR